MTILLRPYQSAAIDSAAALTAQGKRAICFVAPCGAGKTTLAASISKRHQALGGKVLFLAHRAELVGQAEDRMRCFGVMATVTTIQALAAARRRGSELPKATLVFFDECHTVGMGDDWSLVAGHYRDAIRLGLTATPARGDGRGLGTLFEELVVVATISELTAAGHLVPLRIIAPDKRLDPGELAQPPAAAYQTHCPGKRALVFAANIEEAKKIQVDFDAAGVRSGIVHGTLTPSQRAQVLQEYAQGYRPVVINCQILVAGFDCPATDAVILARGCSFLGTLIQIVGRAMRPSEGKTEALFIDLAGVTHVLGRPDEDVEYSLEGKGIRAAEDAPRFCSVCSVLLAEDAVVCTECGTTTGSTRKPQKVVNVPLGDFIAAKCGDLDKRARQLAHWTREGFLRGYKHGWATKQFKRETGFWPTKKMTDLATEFAKGTP